LQQPQSPSDRNPVKNQPFDADRPALTQPEKPRKTLHNNAVNAEMMNKING
jgi:hypothetical protein